ncbi:MAG TPA: phospholipase D-like domain-containing protein [Terriglobales bacterium]|nr:phospholipase D-like domain-containing protein [Terriglobales bacterium]
MSTASFAIADTVSSSASANGLTVRAYAGDGDVLLAFSLDEDEVKSNKLAGFAIQCTPPIGQPYFLLNRINFSQAVTDDTTPQQTTWTSSYDAPFQKFYWVHFPSEIVAGEKGHHVYRYKVITRYCAASGLEDGPSVEISVDLSAQSFDNFEFGFTRGYLTSQAYAAKFQNKEIRPQQKSIDYDTAPYEAQYEWLGFHARQMIFDFLKECAADPSITVDLLAYDFDEPDIIKMFESLGHRLRAFLDNSKLHTGTALEVQTHTRLVQSAGLSNVKQGHFKRYAHDKIIIQKKNGEPTKVLTGSANFSVRGLYVQANNVLVFDNPDVAKLYEQMFDETFDDMSSFSSSPLAEQWFPKDDFELTGIPKFRVSFAPHKDASASLNLVADAIKNAKSSVLFAVMELTGGGAVLQALQNMHLSGKVFSYGMTQSEKGFSVYKPGQPGILVPFAVLDKHVPPPFDKEWSGGSGQVIHDKFVVVDFNDENPVVFTGSSNLAQGGEQSNGDNLLAIYDPVVARAFAVEAIRLVDHYDFRATVSAPGVAVHPVMLSPCSSSTPWWERDYDPNDMHCVERELFALGPSGESAIPHSTTGGGGARAFHSGNGGSLPKRRTSPATGHRLLAQSAKPASHRKKKRSPGN